MREVYYLTGDEPRVNQIVRKTFPDYGGRLFKLVISDAPVDVYPKCPKGTLVEFAFCDLATLESIPVVGVKKERLRRATRLPHGIAAVEHRYERGRDAGITIYVEPHDVEPGLLPERVVDLSQDEWIVLRFTARYKASWGRDLKHRQGRAQRATGITLERWNTARESLRDRGLLTRKFSMAPAGRNALHDDHKALHAERKAI